MSFVDKLNAAVAEAEACDVDPWRLPLGRLQGEIDIGDIGPRCGCALRPEAVI
jgi:hypothetical protein